MGAEGGVDVLRGELAHAGPVVCPGAPVTDNLHSAPLMGGNLGQ